MENEEQKAPEQQDAPEQEGYVERPAWQVWGARVGLVIFLLFVVYQILSIARGGL